MSILSIRRLPGQCLFIASLLLFSLGANASPAPIKGTFAGTNEGQTNQNIVANCTDFDTGGLQSQLAQAELTFASDGKGRISYEVIGQALAIGIIISNLNASGGTFTGPFGIAGNIFVTSLVLQGSALLVNMQLFGNCLGGTFQADFAALLLAGAIFQSALTSLTDSTAFTDDFRRGMRTLAAFNTLAFVTTALLLGEEEDGIGIARIPNGVRVQGRSGGDGFGYPWGLWASYQRDESENDFAATAYDSDTDTVMVGADFSAWDNVVTGAAFGYTSSDIDTTFNGGQGDVDSFSVVPYMAVHLSEYVGVGFDLIADVKVGFSFVDVDQFRTTAGSRVSSSTDANRYFFSGNLSAAKDYGNWRLGARAGWLVARENRDGFTESDGSVIPDRQNDFGQLSIGGEASYAWGAFEPFASATYLYDYEIQEVVTSGVQPANDKDSVLVGAGLRWYGDSLSAAFEWNGEFAREDFDSNTLMFTLRSDF